jgi:hypothetical protein
MNIIEERIKIFLEFEAKNKLFDKSIDNIKYWIYIRNYIFLLTLEKDLDLSINQKNFKLSQFIYNVLNCNKLKIKSNNYDIGIYIASNKEKSENGYICPLIDVWLDDLNVNSIIFERPNKDMNKKNNLFRNLYYTNRIDLKRLIKYTLNKPFSKKYNKYVDNILDDLDKLYNMKLNREAIYNRIEYIISSVRIGEKEYRKLLMKYKIKTLLTVCHYDVTSMIMIKVAHSLGINVVELQHGVMGGSHISYNYLNNDFENECLPDKIFIFGKYWRDCTNFPNKENSMKVVGCPSLELNYDKQSYVKRHDKGILFLSGMNCDLFIDLAIKLSRILPNDYKIIYKLHPSEYINWKKAYPNLWKEQKAGKIVVVDNSEKSINYYFAKSTYQVGVGSTAIFEGLKFNLKTFVYNVLGKEILCDLYKNGYATLFDDAKRLAFLIQNDNLIVEHDTKYFWSNNAKIKLLNELKEELNIE